MPDLNTHYHINGVCREHGAAPLKVVANHDDVLTELANRFDGKLEEKYASVEYGEFTTRYFEANVVDRNGESHELFFSYATHTDTDIPAQVCQEQLEVMRMIEEMQNAMRAVFGEGDVTIPQQQPQTEGDELPQIEDMDALFKSLGDFLGNTDNQNQ